MTEWIAVVTITLLAVISPGADFAMVTRNSLLRSRRAGMLTALGIGLGVLVHVGYTLLGVGLLMQQSTWLFDVVKLLGAAYLIYLGVTMLRSRPDGEMASQPAAVLSDMAALRTGFLTNALNPKTTVFFAAFLPQFLSPGAPPMFQGMALGFLFVAIAAVTDSAYALAAGIAAPALRRGATRRIGQQLGGGVFIGLGILTALAGSRGDK